MVIFSSIGHRRWRTIAAGLFLVAASGSFTSLGLWQLERADEQRRFEEAVRERQALPPLDLTVTSVEPGEVYRRAVAEGVFEGSRQIYLEGRRHQGRIGYHVITPLRLLGSRRYVLINRGWVAQGEERVAAQVPIGRVRFSGLLQASNRPPLRWASPKGRMRPYLDIDEYRGETAMALEPLILVAAEPGRGLAAVKPELYSKQGMHEGYAVQWLTFAALAGVTAAALLTRGPRA